MEDIKVGEYVRTKNGKIDKVKNNDYYMQQYIECEKGLYLRDNITKHSFNLIDLLEYGDYINLERILDITEEYIRTTETIHNKSWLAKNITSIPTHEQFEANYYTVKGE